MFIDLEGKGPISTFNEVDTTTRGITVGVDEGAVEGLDEVEVVGGDDGDEDDRFVGRVEGNNDGLDEGDKLGDCVGREDGNIDGLDVLGGLVGESDGRSVGAVVGKKLGKVETLGCTEGK